MTEGNWPGRQENPFSSARILGRTEALLAVAGIGAWLYDAVRKELWWSAETRRILGVGNDYIPDIASAIDFYTAESRPIITKALADIAETGTPWDLELPMVNATGEPIWVRARGRTADYPALPGTILGTFEDITERHRDAEEHERLALIVRQMTNAAFITDAGGRAVWVNDAFAQLTGFSRDEVVGKQPHTLLRGADTDADDLKAIFTAMTAGEPICREILNYHRDGASFWIEIRVDPIRDNANRITGFIAIASDITARRQAADDARRELKLRSETETLLRDVIEGIPAALTVYDSHERLVLVNESYKHLLPSAATLASKGDSLEAIVRRKVEADHYAPEILGSAPHNQREAWVQDYLQRHRSADYNRIFHLSNGRWVQAENARSSSGNILSIRTDITRLKHAEAELRHLAEHDTLTGLANRPVLLRRLAEQVRNQCGAVVVIDVDFFKSVNDGIGHGAGDLLLRIVARRLQRLARATDTVARLGGDEFALILPGLGAGPDLTAFLDRLIANQRRPVQLGANRYVPSVSVGVMTYDGDCAGADVALSKADAALYEAKRQGRGRYTLFGAELAARVERRTLLADRLRIAIPQGAMQVALQPQMRLDDGGISGFEALARWRDSDKWVAPSEFIPIAEDVGLAQALGSAVMDKAMAAHVGLLATGRAPGLIAINVSTAQMLSDDFLEIVRTLLARHGLAPQALEIEVTETVLLDRSVTRIVQILETLRAHGITLSLDDFGTGYASLASLTAFPVDRIKIDASFIRDIGQPGDPGLIARTIINLGNGLGLGVIAEGVETRPQLDFLRANGCTVAQGYLIAPPMLPDTARRWLMDRPRQRSRPHGVMRAG